MNKENLKGIKMNFIGHFYNCRNCKEKILMEIEPEFYEIDSKENVFIYFKNLEENEMGIKIESDI
jgi:hypothetical protein